MSVGNKATVSCPCSQTLQVGSGTVQRRSLQEATRMACEPNRGPMPAGPIVVDSNQRDNYPPSLRLSNTPEIPLHPSRMGSKGIVKREIRS